MTVKNVALIGNQNCGKTTLFNLLTGSHQYVGNWPGVTVDRVEGRIAKKDISIVDLPGLYSLSPYSPEEVVSRNYLLTDEYDVILNIVDASHLERSLSLTLECAAFNKPMVIALNMIDLLDKSDISIDIEKLSKKLGIEVVKISAVKSEGIDELVNAIENAKVPNLPSVFGADVESLIDDVASSLEPSLKVGGRRFVATALLKDDDIFVEEYKDKIEIMAKVTKAKNIIKEQSSIDAQSFFPKKRYEFIDAILDECRVKKTVKSSAFSEALDKIVLNRFLALPIFLVVVGLVYFGAMYFTSYLELIPFANDEGETEYATITDWVNDNFFGGYVTDLATALCESAEAPEWLQSLAIDGVVGGVGAVLGFLPQIAFLFLFLSFLEQSGYMTRVAFVLDRIFRSFGMSGRNFIPMVIATGCGVPALMANKTIDNINERRIGLITTTFIPCSAKLPIMTMIFASVMDGAWWFAPFVYGMSIFSIIVTGLILKKNSAFKEEVSPFVMEIPDYHMPTLRNILKEVYNRCKAFVVKAGTVIFTVVVVVWFLANFGMGETGFGMVEDVDNSILAVIGSALCFIFIPLGFSSWQATVAVINGLLAKENVVGTMAVVLGLDGEFEGDEESLSGALSSYFADLSGSTSGSVLVTITGLSFLTFNLWSTPCAAALGAMKRQMGSNRWWSFAISYMTLWAYFMALVIYQVGGLLTGTVEFNVFTVVAFALLAVFFYMLFKKDRAEKPSLRIASKTV